MALGGTAAPCRLACLAPSQAPRSKPPTSRRRPALQVVRAGGAAATVDGLTEALHGSHPAAHLDLLHATELSNIVELPSRKPGAAEQRPQQVAAPAPAPPRGPPGAPKEAPPARRTPRVLEVSSASELRHLMACHPNRLLVVHFAAAGCPVAAAFAPALTDACQRFPSALFLRIEVPPPAEQSPLASNENTILFQGLHLGALPCTLLLLGQQQLARLEMGGGDGAAAAARALTAAVAAALPPEPAPAAPPPAEPAPAATAPKAIARGPRYSYAVLA